MPNDADRAGTPAGVSGAELRFYRTRAGLSQKDLAARANVSHDVISKIETGERPSLRARHLEDLHRAGKGGCSGIALVPAAATSARSTASSSPPISIAPRPTAWR